MTGFSSVTHNITIESDVTLEEVLRFEDDKGNIVDLTGFTARIEVRTAKGEDPDVTDPILVLTTENGGITIDPNLGKITILIPVTEVGFSGYYDLLLVSADDKQYKPIVPSKLKVKPSVTSLPA